MDYSADEPISIICVNAALKAEWDARKLGAASIMRKAIRI